MRLNQFLVFVLLVPSFLFSQRFSFIQYNTNKGLPQSQVNTITQDDVGYLWIGTYGGLARFDGENFKNFGRNNGLLNNRITKLEVISGILYIGHPQGVSIKNTDNTFNAIPYSNALLLEDVSGFAAIDSTVFVSTNGGGLFTLDRDNEKLIPFKGSPLRIRDLIKHNGNIYLAARTGLFRFDGKKSHLIDESGDISFSGLALDGEKLIATSFNGTLYQLDTNQNKIEPILSSDHWLFRNVIVDHRKQKWINSRDGILLIKETDTLQITERSGLLSNDIDEVFEDSENNIWIGTNGKGLIRFTDEVFTYYNENSGFSSDLIIAIEIDSRNNKWISTIDQGVFKMDPSGKITKIDFISSAVWQIMSADDIVLFASNFGLFTYDYSEFKSFYREENNLPSNSVKGLYALDDSTFFISTSNGGILFDRKSKSLKHEEHIYSGIESARDFEKDGEVLYAAAPNGIYIANGEEITQKHFDSGINCIELDMNGILWIGTENGLFIKHEDDYTHFNLEKENGLEYINFIQKYDSLMFIGTNNGLYEIEVNSFQKYRYGISSGLIDLETNLNSSFIENNRYLWFGTASGLMKMDLHNRASLMKSGLPRIQLTNIIVNNKELSQTLVNNFNTSKTKNKLTIKYADKNITFKFDGIYMSNPGALRYSHYLEGFSDEWTLPTDNASASFTNLPPGKYVFKFKVNNGIVKTSEIFTITLEVLPPFYRTWWFYIVIGGLISLVVIAIDRARAKRLESKNYQVKLEFQNKLSKLEQQSLNASMNRHFIFNSLNSIQYYINTSDTKSANKYLSRFAKLIRKNLDSSYHEDGMVVLMDEIDRLRLYLDLESMRFVDRFDYSIVIDESIETELLKVFAMFLQPFVENSIIHGILPLRDKKGKIEIIVSDHLDHIRIEIKDNGVGIESSLANKKVDLDAHRSQGMLIAKRRIELLQKISERSIEIIGPHQIKGNNSLINGTVVTFKIMKQYLG